MLIIAIVLVAHMLVMMENVHAPVVFNILVADAEQLQQIIVLLVSFLQHLIHVLVILQAVLTLVQAILVHVQLEVAPLIQKNMVVVALNLPVLHHMSQIQLTILQIQVEQPLAYVLLIDQFNTMELVYHLAQLH